MSELVNSSASAKQFQLEESIGKPGFVMVS